MSEVDGKNPRITRGDFFFYSLASQVVLEFAQVLQRS
jgi:hypothetical protein